MSPASPRKRSTQGRIGIGGYPASPLHSWGWIMDVIFTHCAGLDVHKKRVTACRVIPDPTDRHAEGLIEVKDFGTMTSDLLALANWLAVVGIGPVSATALLAAIGDATQFTNGRQLAAWLGLVPREHSTGGTPRLLGVSTRGNSYLRKLFVHGARATLRWIDTNNDERSRWLRALIARRGKHRAAVALANKNAQMVWALLAHDQAYHARTPA
jgi:hypothetical protein